MDSPSAPPTAPATLPETPAGSPFARLGRRLLVPFLLGVLACLVLALYSDGRRLAGAIGAFPLAVLWPLLALSVVNYGLRYWRWQLLLRQLRSPLGPGDGLGVFLVGFTMTVTPGRAGELSKGWLVRELGGGPARRGVAAVLAERLTDGIGVCLLLVTAGALLPDLRWIAAGAAAIAIAGLGFLFSPAPARWLTRLTGWVPWLGRRAAVVGDVLAGVRAALPARMLLFSLVIALVAWAAEGLGCFLVVRAYSSEAALLPALVAYGLATIAGGISMLPGGLLVTEGVLALLLERMALDRAAASSATLITRAATLWFAVLLGLVALPLVLRRLRRRAAADRDGR